MLLLFIFGKEIVVWLHKSKSSLSIFISDSLVFCYLFRKLKAFYFRPESRILMEKVGIKSKHLKFFFVLGVKKSWRCLSFRKPSDYWGLFREFFHHLLVIAWQPCAALFHTKQHYQKSQKQLDFRQKMQMCRQGKAKETALLKVEQGILVKLNSDEVLRLREEQLTSFDIDFYCKSKQSFYSFFLLRDEWWDSTVFEASIFIKREEVCSSSMSGAQAQVHKTLLRELEFLLQTKL